MIADVTAAIIAMIAPLISEGIEACFGTQVCLAM